MYASFIKHVTFPLYEMRRGSDLMKTIRAFQKSQWFQAEELRVLQWQKLKGILNHAHRNVPYYREMFRSIGALPGDIRSWDDFAKLPTINKQTLQERLDDLIAENVPSAELMKGVTSGSSGRPTTYIQDRPNNRIRKAAGRRLTQIAGYDFGLKLLYIWRDSPFVIEGDRVSQVPERSAEQVPLLKRLKKSLYDRFAVENPTVRVDPTLMTEAEMAKMYDRLRAFKPDVVISYVNTLYMFAQYIESNRLGGIAPRSVIVSSETLYPHQRALMEQVFGCRVYNRYGLSETGIVAIECPVREGLHLNQEILHMEYVPDPFGNSQLIVTDLINHGMPLLRYETGDSGRLIEEPCPCGRGLARIGDLSGRIIDLLPTRLGGHVNGQLFATFHWIEGVKQYQVVQEQIDTFKVRIVPTASFQENNLTPMLQTIRERFGQDASVRVEYLDTIPFTKGGKYRLVVSEVKKQEAPK